VPGTDVSRSAADDRRRRIEEAATVLFARNGYAATTVDDIVKAAGLTKPMLYRHFESKQELCISLLERYRDELVAAPLAQFSAQSTHGRSELIKMTEAWLGHTQAHPDASRLLFESISGDVEIETVQRDLHARQRATLTALLREFATLDDAEAEPMGEVVRVGLAAVALWGIEHPDTPRDALVGVLLRMVEGLIGTIDDRLQQEETK